MRKQNFIFSSIVILLTIPFLTGLSMIGVKQLSRNNINEETLSTITLCQTTRDEIVDLFRAPTEDFISKQGEYTVYTYKGFSGRGALQKQKLEILLDDDGRVVDFRLNDESREPMTDKCLEN